MKKKKKKSAKNNKKKVVKKLVPQAATALENEFFLETSWILTSIFEAKLRRILTMLTRVKPGTGFGLQKCLQRIKLLYLKGTHPLLIKHIEIRLIDDLRTWKNHRNSIYQDIRDIHVSPRRIKRMAEEGIVLHQELVTVYNNLKKDWKRDLVKDSPLPVKINEQTAQN